MQAGQETIRTRYAYNFDELERAPEGPCSATVTPRRLISGSKTLATAKATSTGAIVTGERFHVTLVLKPRGTGSKIHTHPNEQFNYVLQGCLIADIDGQVLLVPKGHVVHIPAGMPHSHVSTADDDVWFFAAKDTRYGITGPAVDGKHDGPRYLPGFFRPEFGVAGRNQWDLGPDGLPAPQTQNQSGRKLRFVYKLDELADLAADDCSARVTPASRGSGGGIESLGSLAGQRVKIELVRLPRGASVEQESQPHEQFNWVLSGKLLAEVEGQKIEVHERSVLHLPEGIANRYQAGGESDVLIYVVTPAQAR